MAQCTNCGKSVGCSCSLIGGLCTNCYSNRTNSNLRQTDTIQTNYTTPTNGGEPNTDFSIILNTPGISREEKLKRINDILDKAIQQ